MPGGRPRGSDVAITTKDPEYIRARELLEMRWSRIPVIQAALILGVTESTARNYAALGKFGSRKESRTGPWVFDVNELRREIGLEPLSDWID